MTSAMDSSTTRRRVQQEPKSQEQNGHITPNDTISLSQLSPPTTFSSSISTPSTAISILQIWAPTLLLIFGGCCSNVYTLESLISASPTSGSLITFFQFLLVTIFTLPRHFSPNRGIQHLWLKERSIPLRKWVVFTLYFLSINVLNNLAFRYKIGVPLHIILRSAGPVTTMLAGRIIKGRRYPTLKVVAVVLLFSGVVLAAVSDAWAKQSHVRTAVVETDSTEVAADRGRAVAAWSAQAPGFALLASALILSACMGLFTDDMYAMHGRSGAVTAETLFYSHTMSLPYFLSQVRPMFVEFTSLLAVPAHEIGSVNSKSPLSTPTSLLDTLTLFIPRPLLLLALNAATQLLCIVGVNRLSAQSSALTVSIVLNIRKLASLVLSIWLFGNALPTGVLVGAGTVFLGGGLYALPVRDGKKQERIRSGEKQKKER